MAGKRRCRMHGGKRLGSQPWYRRNDGPAVAGSRRKQALYRAFGLIWPGGRPRKAAVAVSLVEKARIVVTDAKRDLVKAIPEIVNLASDDRAFAELSPTEALARVAWKGLERLDQLMSIDIPVGDVIELRENAKVWRLVGDMALGANRLLASVGEGGARVQRDQQLALLLEEIRRDKALARVKG